MLHCGERFAHVLWVARNRVCDQPYPTRKPRARPLLDATPSLSKEPPHGTAKAVCMRSIGKRESVDPTHQHRLERFPCCTLRSLSIHLLGNLCFGRSRRACFLLTSKKYAWKSWQERKTDTITVGGMAFEAQLEPPTGRQQASRICRLKIYSLQRRVSPRKKSSCSQLGSYVKAGLTSIQKPCIALALPQ